MNCTSARFIFYKANFVIGIVITAVKLDVNVCFQKSIRNGFFTMNIVEMINIITEIDRINVAINQAARAHASLFHYK